MQNEDLKFKYCNALGPASALQYLNYMTTFLALACDRLSV